MFKRKLTALEFQPKKVETFNINDETQFRDVVLWLEEQKIRVYRVEERDPLRDVQSEAWPNALSQYCRDLGCPVDSTKKTEVLEWLLGEAVRLEYDDNKEKYSIHTAEEVLKNSQNAPRVVSTNPLDNMDFDGEEFKNGINSLAKQLNVTCHPDVRVTCQAISKVITERLGSEVIDNPQNFIPKGTPFPYATVDDGIYKNEPVLADAVKILRLLFLQDLRSLQTSINEAIVAVQNLTANPKTDTALGKVGR